MPTSNFDDYGIHPVHGFLPLNPPPLRRLSDSYYSPWEDIISDLQNLCLVGKLRSVVKKLPILDSNRLISLRERERAYSVLSFISHAYIWGYPKMDGVDTYLPACLAVPWTNVAKTLGRKPVISYAATVLYNFRLIDADGPLDLSNLAAIITFTGSMDESWFYLISLAIEIAGAPAIPAIVKAQRLIATSKTMVSDPLNTPVEEINQLSNFLSTIGKSIEAMTPIMGRMHERNDPHFFYNRTRWFQSGWKGVEDVMPQGVFYEGVTEIDEHVVKLESNGTWRIYAGASAGQSPLVHALDVALGVEHRTMSFPSSTTNGAPNEPATTLFADSPHRNSPTIYLQPESPNDVNHKSSFPPLPSSSSSSEPAPNPMLEMRDYLSTPHRKFLESLSSGASIRQVIQQFSLQPISVDVDHTSNTIQSVTARTEAINQFNRCIEALRKFRDRHLQIVAVYIVLQSKKSRAVKPPVLSTSNIVNVERSPGSGITEYSPRLGFSDFPTSGPSLPLSSSPNLTSSDWVEVDPSENGEEKNKRSSVSFFGVAASAVASVVENMQTAIGSTLQPTPQVSVMPKKQDMKGTGGTDLLPFLRQTRSETIDALVGHCEPKKLKK